MYVVETCDANDAPDEREYVPIGQYGKATDAIAAAQAVIEAHLSMALSAGMTAAETVEDWNRSGEIPRIVVRGGGAPVSFDALAFARDRASQLQRRA